MKKHVFGLAVSLLVALVMPAVVEASTITIDGNFSDWSGVTAIGTDASGDASGDIVDWTNLWATNNAGILYLSYQTVSNVDFVSNAWRYSIYIDADNNPSTGYKGTDGSFLIGAEYLIEWGNLHQYTGNGTSWSWTATASLAYSFTANRLEMAIPESNLGLSGDYTVKIMLFGNNPTTPDFSPDNKSGFAYSRTVPAAGLNSSTKYLWYCGDNWNADKTEEAKNYRFVLIHLTNGDITPEQIAEVKKGKDGIAGTDDDVFFIGYVSVGEDVRTDVDHGSPTPYAGDGTGPVYYDYENKQIVHTNKGYASYYLDEIINDMYNTLGHDGLPDRNAQYGGCYCNPGDPAWQNLLKTATKANDGFVGFDEAINVYGCDGVMLDTIDVATPNSLGYPYYFEWTASGLYDLVKNLRAWYPDKVIFLNRGLVFYDPNQKQANGTRYAETWNLGQYIDMVLFEGYCHQGDEKRNRYYWAPKLNAEADRTNGFGFTVVALDYPGDAGIVLDGNFDDWTPSWRVWGLEGVQKLDESRIWSTGLYTPDELADDVGVPAIDMTDMWAANDKNNENVFIRISFKGTIDFANYDYHVFLDTDQNKNTGYWRMYGSATGADYMIFDGDNQNLHLYKYIGTDNTSWSWQWLGFIPFAVGSADGGINNSIEMRVPKSMIGETTAFNEALNLTFLAEKKGAVYIDDFAPDDQTLYYYEYPELTKALVFKETTVEQGWLEYIVPMGSFRDYIDHFTIDNDPPADTQPPVWDSTAASPGAKPPSPPTSRVGIQEAEPGDHSVTVRWDVARDQTRPISYNIYYSATTPINFNTATKLSHVDTSKAGRNYYKGTGVRTDFPNGSESTDGFYSERIGEGVYPYEYTVTGLTNGQMYYFAVRAEDSCNPPHEDTNAVELSAAPFLPRVRYINFDGNFNDWQGAQQLDFSPGEGENEAGFPPELDILDINAANGCFPLYIKLRCKGAIDMANSNYDVFIDVDGDNTTGYAGPYIPTYPWAIGADYLVQDGKLFEHTPINGYRVWNWTFLGDIPFAIGDDGGVQNAIEMYIPRLPICYHSWTGHKPSNSYKILVRSDRLVGSEEHICDYAPNDPFSHAYDWKIIGLVIDGHFEDWLPWAKDGDYSGDVSPGDLVDWERFEAARQEGNLYLYYQTVSDIDFASNAWRYAIYLDTDNNSATGYKGTDGSYGIGAEYLIEGSALLRYTGTGTDWSWNVVSSINYAYTGNTMEMAIPDSDLGLNEESTIKALFVGNNPTTIDYARNDKSGVTLWAPWMYNGDPHYYF